MPHASFAETSLSVARWGARCDFLNVRAIMSVVAQLVGAGGRAVECSGLENRWTFTGPVGSNPTLPARVCTCVVSAALHRARALTTEERGAVSRWYRIDTQLTILYARV